jgi:hypothetical protein
MMCVVTITHMDTARLSTHGRTHSERPESIWFRSNTSAIESEGERPLGGSEGRNLC